MTSSWVSDYKVPRVDYSMALLRNPRLGSIGAGHGVLGCGGGYVVKGQCVVKMLGVDYVREVKILREGK
jgi:hypothetical protein